VLALGRERAKANTKCLRWEHIIVTNSVRCHKREISFRPEKATLLGSKLAGNRKCSGVTEVIQNELTSISRSTSRIPISIVINTYNRAQHLPTTLEGLRTQTYPEFEVVVVNGPSTDGTDLLLRHYAMDLKIVCCPEPRLGVSRNLGIEMAAGEIVAFIDDDAVPDNGWLERLASAYADPSVAAAGGYVFDIPLGHVAWRVCTCTRSGEWSANSPRPAKAYLGRGADPFLYLNGCNMSFRRCALLEIGGFNEEFTYAYDDVDVCCRIIDAGHQIALVEDAIVYHQRAPNSVRSLDGVVRDLYPIFYARTVFALQWHSSKDSSKRIISRIRKIARRVTKGVRRQLVGGLLTPDEFEHFVHRIHRAVDDGVATAMRSKSVRTFEAPELAAFHPYPRSRAIVPRR
jgi:GT2 family glycosyltransferase